MKTVTIPPIPSRTVRVDGCYNCPHREYHQGMSDMRGYYCSLQSKKNYGFGVNINIEVREQTFERNCPL
jgi:hypothetical protein